MTVPRVLILLLASGAAAATQSLVWVRGSVRVAVGATELTVAGSDVRPWLATLAGVVALSAALMLLLPRSRRLAGVAVVVAGSVGLVAVVLTVANPAQALAAAMDGQVASAQRAPGLWLALAAWLVVTGAGVAALRPPQRRPRSTRPGADASPSTEMWDSLSRGEDPTHRPAP